jgi:hypothetical protein
LRQKPGETPGFLFLEAKVTAGRRSEAIAAHDGRSPNTRENSSMLAGSTRMSARIHRSFNMSSRCSPRVIQSDMNTTNPRRKIRPLPNS